MEFTAPAYVQRISHHLKICVIMSDARPGAHRAVVRDGVSVAKDLLLILGVQLTPTNHNIQEHSAKPRCLHQHSGSDGDERWALNTARRDNQRD